MAAFKLCSLLALALLSNAHPTSSHTDLFVQTNLFSAKGISWPNETSVRFFGGIPYAEPPIGSNRFRPPVTKKPSNETIDASWFGPSCIQYSNGAATVYSEYLTGFLLSPGQQQSEDCLTLNIWTPRSTEKEDKKLKPVMIWIHGGGFTSGGSASPYKYGHRLAKDQDVLVVAIKYGLFEM
jgi:carboxylesterase type B